MKANIKTITLGLFVCLNHYLQAQVSSTNAELHNRYWNYRENLRKYFVILSQDPGGGMQFSDIQPNHSPENHKVDASGNYISGGTLKGNVNVGGDVTAYYAEYLAVLASEYWLLHNDGMAGSQEEKAVLNELYFAINAIDRLDKYAEAYFSNFTTPGKLNGFIQRDDLPNRHLEDLYKYDRHAPRNNFGNTSGVYHIDTMHIDGKVIYFGPDSIQLKPEKNTWDFGYKRPEWEVHKAGQPSQDQMIGII